jgi:hypothetical protein
MSATPQRSQQPIAVGGCATANQVTHHALKITKRCITRHLTSVQSTTKQLRNLPPIAVTFVHSET